MPNVLANAIGALLAASLVIATYPIRWTWKIASVIVGIVVSLFVSYGTDSFMTFHIVAGAIGLVPWVGAVGQWLAKRPSAGMWLDRVAGGIFVALGLKLIVSR